jgi:hypothetical protein
LVRRRFASPCVLLTSALLVVIAAAPSGAAASYSLKLPSPSDIPPIIDPNIFLGVRPGKFPNKVPGPLTGREAVRVAVAPDGTIKDLIVEQTLFVTGTGDYTLEIPGPALDVSSPPDIGVRAGLRLGSVIWEGFSPGSKTLRATITVDPTARRFFPVPLQIETTSSGLRVRNVTAQRRQVLVADVRADVVADLLDKMHDVARRGRPVRAGVDGIPSTIPASTKPAEELIDVPVVFEVSAEGTATVVPSASHPDAVVLSTSTQDWSIDAVPTAPDPALLDPGARTWRAALRGASRQRIADALLLAESFLWQGLRRQDYEAFLGAPVGGRFTATYRFEAARKVAPPVATDAPEPVKPLGIAMALVALALIGVNGVALWRRS